jgi:protein BCP1
LKEDEDEEEEEVQVDFEMFEVEDKDFIALKQYLTDFLGGTIWNASELVDIIMSQPGVGSVIKVSQEEEVLGFINMINLHKHKVGPAILLICFA